MKLYRHYDHEGRLLYVGVSRNPLERLGQHQCRNSWGDEIATITVEHFGTARGARKAEARAIKNEGPIFNIRGAERERPRSNRASTTVKKDPKSALKLQRTLDSALQQGRITLYGVQRDVGVARDTTRALAKGSRRPHPATEHLLWDYLRRQGAL